MHSHRSEIDKLSYSRPFEAWGGDGASGGGWTLISVQFSLVQSLSFVLLCDPMDRSMPGPPVHHRFPEFTRTLYISRKNIKEGGGRVCQEEEEQKGLLIRGHGGHHIWLKQPAPMLHCPLSLGCLTPSAHVSDDLTQEERGERCEVHISLYKLKVPCVLAWQNTKWSQVGWLFQENPVRHTLILAWNKWSLCYRA